MTSITVSFMLEGTNAELIAQIAKLLQEPVAVAEPVKVKSSKPKRILTEAEKKVIRDRFAAGRAKAALARGEIVAPFKPAKKSDPKVAPVKPISKPSTSSKIPLPRNGRKIEAKSAAE